METVQVSWGVIGAGDVVMRKSGAPLQHLPDSHWIALTRRNQQAAREAALRFGVPRVYPDADSLLSDSDVNAVYVATPPQSHAAYACRALAAGKNVYLEKPMALNADEARTILEAVGESGCKLVMAHYRRALPAFVAVGKLLAEGAIGRPLFARIRIIQPVPEGSGRAIDIAAGSSGTAGTGAVKPKSSASAGRSPSRTSPEDSLPWRLNPALSGGGLFHDLGPQQLDLALSWFGEVQRVEGTARRLAGGTGADDYVSGRIEFSSGLMLDGLWAFCADSGERSADEFSIYGTEGRISFSFFGEEVVLEQTDGRKELRFSLPEWIQQPMLSRCVDYFLDRDENPCPGDFGLQTMKIIDTLTGKA